MKRLAVMSLICFSALATLVRSAPSTDVTASAPEVEDLSAIRFTTVNVHVDAKNIPLAAYQIEFVSDPTRVKLVGVEGGESVAFREPPFYDPAALSRNRVIIAAFSTGDDLPKAPSRIARLHVQITGSAPAAWEAKLIVAATSDGTEIPAEVRLSEGETP